MSKLLAQIKKDQLEARKQKNKDKAKLLTTLLGEATPGGNGVVNDADVLKVITKFVKNTNFTIKNCNELGVLDVLEHELEILKNYLPKELKGAELKVLVYRTIESVHATSMRDMGKIMGKVKTSGYTIDMAKVQQLIKGYFL